MELVGVGSTSGGLVPVEAREIIGQILNRKLPAISDPWAKQPLSLTLAGVQPGGATPALPGVPEVEEASVDSPDTLARLRQLEQTVAQRTVEELRAAGYDHLVTARVFDANGRPLPDEEPDAVEE